MVKSMTGFATVSAEHERATVAVTIRAVNHRFLDLQLRVPAAFSETEGALRATVQRQVARGRVEVTVSLQQRQAAVPQVELQEEFVEAIAAAVAVARARGLVSGELTPGDVLRMPQAFVIRERSGEQTTIDADTSTLALRAVEEALRRLDTMRRIEGEHLARDLAARHALLGELVTRVTAAADRGARALQQRLQLRVQELVGPGVVDAALLAQEVVRVAQRSDISEEVTRFRAHLAHWNALVSSADPCGRKLDFLLQEMNREVNTIGSKADGTGIAEHIVDMKAELERMREQVQNVE